MRAHIRHVHTEYDRLLSRGFERDEARHRIADAVEALADRWRRP